MQIPKGWSKDILYPLHYPYLLPGLTYVSRLKGMRGTGLWTRGNGEDETPTEEWGEEDLLSFPMVVLGFFLQHRARGCGSMCLDLPSGGSTPLIGVPLWPIASPRHFCLCSKLPWMLFLMGKDWCSCFLYNSCCLLLGESPQSKFKVDSEELTGSIIQIHNSFNRRNLHTQTKQLLPVVARVYTLPRTGSLLYRDHILTIL